MRKVLLAWEIGEAYGHVSRFQPIAAELIKRNADVSLAVRDLSRVADIFRELPVQLWQAPSKNSRIRNPKVTIQTFPHLLHNSGFESPAELFSMVNAWRSIFDFVKPDVVVCDLAPVALLAAQLLGIKTAQIGTGFCCPPAISPLPALYAHQANSGNLHEEETLIDNTISIVAKKINSSKICSYVDLLRNTNKTILATYPELDHYPSRSESDYRGVWFPEGEYCEHFTNHGSKKVFVYLKGVPGTLELLKLLDCWELDTLAFIDRFDQANNLAFKNVKLAESRVDLSIVTQHADLAITHGGHGVSAQFLTAGVPVLALPLHYEQAITATRINEQKLGAYANLTNVVALEASLGRLLFDATFRNNAIEFAKRSEEYQSFKQPSIIADELIDL